MHKFLNNSNQNQDKLVANPKYAKKAILQSKKGVCKNSNDPVQKVQVFLGAQGDEKQQKR